jgi:hypothetical protein
MMLYCIHNWSQWIEIPEAPLGDVVVRLKTCTGLCKRTWLETEPEPAVAVGRIE